ncbi:unnamed protein product [Cylicocyclus nassatus]|uniref:Uncharacterized protein n=1 Tax=Cylicocyclus nassatus TaxID=53992 RepID=A0AA36GC64_CYLNA|nr:unnamed protein product [Cylicocyclus nassatus]
MLRVLIHTVQRPLRLNKPKTLSSLLSGKRKFYWSLTSSLLFFLQYSALCSTSSSSCFEYTSMASASDRQECGDVSSHAGASKEINDDQWRSGSQMQKDESDAVDRQKEEKRKEDHPSRSHDISSRIRKRKMPVRRPTAYVPDKNSSEEKEDDEVKNSEEKAPVTEDSKRSAHPENRLYELSMKYRHHECSPDRGTLTPSTKASCG